MSKILVAEDDPVSRKLICHAIESLGHSTIQASDGELGLSILRDNPDIQLVITDMMMPRLNGKEMILTMRGSALYARLPVIIISGVVSLSEIIEVMELGAHRFLPKPLDFGELKHYVRILLDSERTDQHLTV